MLGQSVVLNTGLDTASSLLSYTASSSADDFFQKYEELIGYVLQILTFFGVWAFVRGMLMVKMTAEGKQQQSYMSGIVDRKSTRMLQSLLRISYDDFCLK